MSSTAQTTARGIPAWRSPWVIAWIALIVVVLGVNGVMIFLAFATNPGLVNDDYYERGQDYEETLISRRNADPGWTIQADIPRGVVANEETTIRTFLVDKAGQPVVADSVTFYAYRPSDKSADFSLPMEAEGDGRYAVKTRFPLYGYWDTVLAVVHDGEEYSSGGRIKVARP
jgi:nitrogen fixation protein FixH